jgi:hypothetical protein
MKNKLESKLDEFLSDENNKEVDDKENEDKIKLIKSDFTIIERLDKIILAENGKQLLREVY